MSGRLIFGALVVIWELSAVRAVAQTPEIVFNALETRLAGGQPQIVNGAPPTDPREWRSILVADLDASGARRCTAAIVGERAVLTAAHCFDFGDHYVRAPVLVVDGTRVAMSCALHQAYEAVQDYVPGAPRSRADYALCRLGAAPGAIPALKDVPYEVVDLAAPKLGEALILDGYGCTKMRATTDGGVEADLNSHAFNVGTDAIDRIDVGQRTYIESLSPNGQQPALCKGDSGGPALSPAKAKEDRRVRGVASAVLSEWKGAQFAFVSRVAPTGANGFAAFASTWLANNPDAWICGISAGHEGGTPGCRD